MKTKHILGKRVFLILVSFLFFIFDSSFLFSQIDSTYILPDLIPYRKGNRWGFCDKEKNIVIPCRYDLVELFTNGLAKVVLNDKSFYIDKNNKFVKEVDERENNSIGYGLYRFNEGGKFGIVDSNNKILLPAIYDQIESFFKGYIIRNGIEETLYNNFARIKSGRKEGLIDCTGKLKIPIEYNLLFSTDSENNLIKAELNFKEGYIDWNNNIIIPFIYEFIGSFSKEGLARAKNFNHQFGFIDVKGNVVIPFIYDDASDFFQGLARVRINGKSRFINKKGETIIPFIYEEASSFYEDELAIVTLNGKDGIINKSGEVVIPFIYDRISSCFKNGYAEVSKFRENDKIGMGIIDKSGNLVVDFKYFLVDICYNGDYAKVCSNVNGKWGYIDMKGNEITPLKYDFVYFFEKDYAYVYSGKKYGIIDKTGREITPIKYENKINILERFVELMPHLKHGLIKVYYNKKDGFIDINGTEYWEEN